MSAPVVLTSQPWPDPLAGKPVLAKASLRAFLGFLSGIGSTIPPFVAGLASVQFPVGRGRRLQPAVCRQPRLC
jgi:hypothetical protein